MTGGSLLLLAMIGIAVAAARLLTYGLARPAEVSKARVGDAFLTLDLVMLAASHADRSGLGCLIGLAVTATRIHRLQRITFCRRRLRCRRAGDGSKAWIEMSIATSRWPSEC
jgi:hypothetical protein